MRICKTVLILLLLLLSASSLAEETPALPVDFSPGKPVSQQNYLSDWEYKDPSIHVTIESGRKHDCDYWLARIKIAHPSQLRTAAAGGFENDFVMKAAPIARRQNAVFAINGDYYSFYRYGYVVRQGNLYIDKLKGERDVLAIDEDGNFNVYRTPAAGSLSMTVDGTESGKKIINSFHFGPVLVQEGEVCKMNPWELDWLVPDMKRQRMCIAQTGELEYMALCCAGPARGSYGMTLYEIAQLAKDNGAITCYNLDGGDSTMMVFRNEKINDKDNASARDISDIIYFASAWDGQ